MKRLITIFISTIILPLFSNTNDIYIEHVQNAIERADKRISSLNAGPLALPGMSSSKVRHLLNNLCSLPETNYLEIGVWKGSTFISALQNNQKTISSAIAIDNWSEFEGPKAEFKRNCRRFLKRNKYNFYESNSFEFDLSKISKPINVYFYDGGHSTLDQEMAFTYYNSIFADTFIAMIDDWNHPPVSEGTKNAFDKLNYKVLFEAYLPSNEKNTDDAWWNGIAIFVLQKP